MGKNLILILSSFSFRARYDSFVHLSWLRSAGFYRVLLVTCALVSDFGGFPKRQCLLNSNRVPNSIFFHPYLNAF